MTSTGAGGMVPGRPDPTAGRLPSGPSKARSEKAEAVRRDQQAPAPADLKRSHEETLVTLAELRTVWVAGTQPRPTQSKPPAKPTKALPQAKHSGSDNGKISHLERQGFASPQTAFEEPGQRDTQAKTRTFNLNQERARTEGGVSVKVILKKASAQARQEEVVTPRQPSPLNPGQQYRTMSAFQSMTGVRPAPPKPTAPASPKAESSTSKGQEGGRRTSLEPDRPPPKDFRVNLRGIEAPLSGSLGKQGEEGQPKLANGRVVTSQVPVHSPILDQAHGQPAPTTLQGRELAEFALRHAGHSIESLLKKAYRLDSRDKLSQAEAVRFLTLVLKLGGDFTFSHSNRVLDLAMDLADEIGVDEETRRDVEFGALLKDTGEMALLLDQAPPEKLDQIGNWLSSQDLHQAGLLHDIGKTQIPDEILYKPGKLTQEEYEVMKLHPILGERMIAPIQSLRHLCPVVRGHHERWDGLGYPDGLQGAAIPLGARIIAVADVFDALFSDRPYKAGMPIERVKATLKEGRGTHFDPDLSDAFGKVLQRRYPELGNPFAD